MITEQDALCAKLREAREREGGGTIFDRLRAAKAKLGDPPTDLSYLDDPAFWERWGVRRKPDGTSEVIEPEIEDATPKLSRRKRRPNITTLIKRARRAGERGPVRVELVNDDGTRTIITSSSEALPDAMTEDAAEKLWHERIHKNAAH
jgi:hypothetical protein